MLLHIVKSYIYHRYNYRKCTNQTLALIRCSIEADQVCTVPAGVRVRLKLRGVESCSVDCDVYGSARSSAC